jgi:uncharacterized YigZ family protein
MAQYKSISKQNESSLYKEKGSKFIGYAKVCFNEKEALDFTAQLKREHPQAVHVCYAYQIGIGTTQYRYNDDGEPSNSAGAPIYGQIQSFDITNVVIAVVRYYGGVNLGVGGLINAYRTAAKEVIELSEVIIKEVKLNYRFDFKYSEMAILLDEIKKHTIEITNQHFEQECYLEVSINESEQDLVQMLCNKFQTLKVRRL